MYARSAAFDAAIVNGHVVTASADLLVGGTVVQTGLAITGGDVVVSVTDAVRRHFGLTLIDPDGIFTPTSGPSQLAPYGNELKLYRGIAGLDQLPLGVFRISTASLADNGTRQWTITGYDRSRTISRAKFTQPYVIASGTNYGTAIQTLISGILPGLTYRFVTTTYTTPRLVFDANSDPWQAAQTMAASIGCEVFFDPDGVCVLRPVPDPTGVAAAWSYAEGDQGILLAAERDFTDDPGYNGVVLTAELSGLTNPLRAESWDTDPASPTYYLGPYGKVPMFVQSTLVTSLSQAQAAADALKRSMLGVTEQVQFTTIPHPAHEGGDVIGITRGGLGLGDVFSLEQFTVPLLYSRSLTGTTRRRKAA